MALKYERSPALANCTSNTTWRRLRWAGDGSINTFLAELTPGVKSHQQEEAILGIFRGHTYSRLEEAVFYERAAVNLVFLRTVVSCVKGQSAPASTPYTGLLCSASIPHLLCHV